MGRENSSLECWAEGENQNQGKIYQGRNKNPWKKNYTINLSNKIKEMGYVDQAVGGENSSLECWGKGGTKNEAGMQLGVFQPGLARF